MPAAVVVRVVPDAVAVGAVRGAVVVAEEDKGDVLFWPDRPRYALAEDDSG